ncbi:uncharacterized protein LOC120153958 isoform X2 [Hibiscus syriacus]|nr:uncharacterized protein LOC120153958 isoform X2 [Hibiscus syriacus]
MWDVLVPAKLTTFGWRLCQAILCEIFANGAHWFELAIQHITNEDFKWLLTLLWALWNFRNGNLVHEKGPSKKKNSDFDFERPKRIVFARRIRWNPPPLGVYKVNFDGLFDDHGKKGGIGIIVRDNEGFVWGGAAIKIDVVTEASTCKATAALKALEVAREMGYRRVILESDCVGILSNFLTKDVDHGSQLSCIVYEGKSVMGTIEECYFHHIEREGNQVANLIAKYSLVNEDDLFWKLDYPNFIHQAIMSDAINV